MYQATALNFTDQPVRRGQTAAAPVVQATGADVTDLQGQITAIQTDLATLDFEKANASTVGGLVTRVDALEVRIEALEAQGADHETRIAALEP